MKRNIAVIMVIAAAGRVFLEDPQVLNKRYSDKFYL